MEGLKCRKPDLKPIEITKVDNDREGIAEEEEEPLSPASRLFHEPNFNVYVIAVIGCKTQVQPHIVKANLEHTLLKHPRFSSLQVTDEKNNKEMKWVRTKVDLDKHVIVPELNRSMDSPADKFIEDYIFNLTKTTISKSQPLWDLHLLNISTSDAESIGVFRIHHSLGDGTSLMSLLLACTRQVSDPEALPTLPTMTKKKKKKQEENGKFWRYVMAVWWVIQLFWNTVVDVLMFTVTALFLNDSETPIKGRPGVEFTPRRLIWRTVSLDDIKLVKNAMNTTINDVALGVTQAGLSQYLNRKYGGRKKDEETTQFRNNLPKNISLRATLLINIRPAPGIQALADMMEKNSEAKWGNWIGYVLFPFTIGIRDDPLDYIREAKAAADRKKQSLEAIYTFSIAEIVLKLFGTKVANALSHRTIYHTTMCFSSLVGPPEEIEFYGHPIAFLAPSSFNQPHALMINFQSYANKMTIVLSVDEGTISDSSQLMDDIVESLKLIKDIVLSRGLNV
ncbi:wax ester synthase/diacylglycerol acyltransferase 11 [Ricinus communis]|uniref:Uncharacterized protein n=1 Tax=Ricinus communis TaxID=3988 RepID=B9SBH9_RICCO|nr:wax ester synthase/diacylglycerol acyltransferase 11 [Ricinus communis]EEF39064.1 conserved hypothetical protein [Ricinus communis]|eukprot:XP_002523348.1 O-acyltransferase WSD1 [Ricinus communis]